MTNVKCREWLNPEWHYGGRWNWILMSFFELDSLFWSKAHLYMPSANIINLGLPKSVTYVPESNPDKFLILFYICTANLKSVRPFSRETWKSSKFGTLQLFIIWFMFGIEIEGTGPPVLYGNHGGLKWLSPFGYRLSITTFNYLTILYI